MDNGPCQQCRLSSQDKVYLAGGIFLFFRDAAYWYMMGGCYEMGQWTPMLFDRWMVLTIKHDFMSVKKVSILLEHRMADFTHIPARLLETSTSQTGLRTPTKQL